MGKQAASGDRVKRQTARAREAMSALRKAETDAERLHAAQALKSAACQPRRALKARVG